MRYRSAVTYSKTFVDSQYHLITLEINELFSKIPNSNFLKSNDEYDLVVSVYIIHKIHVV